MDVTEPAAYLRLPVLTDLRLGSLGKGRTAYRFGKHLKFTVSDVRGLGGRAAGNGVAAISALRGAVN